MEKENIKKRIAQLEIMMNKKEDDLKNIINEKDRIIQEMNDKLIYQEKMIKENKEEIKYLKNAINMMNNYCLGNMSPFNMNNFPINFMNPSNPWNPMNPIINPLYTNNMKSIQDINKNNKNDYSPEGRLSIIFSCNSSNVEILADEDCTIRELLKLFARRIGFRENIIDDNKIAFIYNALKLNSRSLKKIKSLALKNKSVIKVDYIGNILNINEYEKNIISVDFNSSLGFKRIIKANKNISFSDLLEIYLNTVGLEENNIGKDIFFLYNGETIAKTPNLIISKLHDHSTIFVLDPSSILETIIQVSFILSSDSQVEIKASFLISVKDLINKFLKEIDIHESYIKNKSIEFLFKKSLIDYKCNKTLKDFGLKDRNYIIVKDNKNILDELLK